MTNAYPELPVLPYQQTTVAMPDVITYLKALPPPAGAAAAAWAEVRRAAYIMFRIESGNGSHGINNNYVGCQGDGARWPAKFDPLFAGTVTHIENGTGRTRIFMAFKSWNGSADFLLDRVRSRGLYIGGATSRVTSMAVDNITNLARAYYKEWVTGSARAEPDKDTIANIASMYGQAVGRVA